MQISAFVRLIVRGGVITIGVLLRVAGPVRAAELDRYDALANGPMAEGRPTIETNKALKDELRGTGIVSPRILSGRTTNGWFS